MTISIQGANRNTHWKALAALIQSMTNAHCVTVYSEDIVTQCTNEDGSIPAPLELPSSDR